MSSFNDFQHFVLSLVHGKMNSKNWISFDAVCCHHNGQHRPDTRKRGGIKFDDDEIGYNCFNCGYKTKQTKGMPLSNNFKQLLRWFNVNEVDINEWNFKLWKDTTPVEDKKQIQFVPFFKEEHLPEKSKEVTSLLNTETSQDYLDVMEYILSRGDDIFNNYTYYWSNTIKFKRSIIIPIIWKDKNIGYVSRKIDQGKNKYFNNFPPNSLFNSNSMYKDRKYILITEGIFDAIGLDCVSAFGSNITPQQISWLNSIQKPKIIVPQRDNRSSALINIALQHGWGVSLPKSHNTNDWESDVKDAAEAVKRYGRLYVLKKIIDNITYDPTSIKVRTKYFVENI